MRQASRPKSIQEITTEAEDFTLNISIPLKVWLRTAQMLCQRGDMHLRKGEWPQAYILYLRYAILITERLKKHPEYKTPAGRVAAKPILAQLPAVFDSLDRMKPLIEREYKQWEVEEARRESIRQQAAEASAQQEQPFEQYGLPRQRRRQHEEQLDLETHRDLAVELAQREMRRREREREQFGGSVVSADQRYNRRVAGIWDQWTVGISEEQAREDDLFRRQMESARAKLDGRETVEEDSHGTTQHSTNYSYPTISQPQAVQYEPSSFHQRIESAVSSAPAPARPPKHEFQYPPAYQSDRFASPLVPPPLPNKETLDSPQPPALPPKDREAPPPTAQKSFRPAAYLENGEPLRSIILPRQLRHRFLDVAEKNTRQGLEMCGMLCGTDVNNVLVVSCLIVPEQKCTSDTCETENENALLEYCMTEDLLMIGWIHTHPTQTCFMSSRDLHTHAGYQIMLPESIAIVCSPTKQPDHGIFRLTNPPGLPHILNCEQQATFHQHSVDNLYTSVERPHGHVVQDDRLSFTVIDLRPGFRDGPGARRTF